MGSFFRVSANLCLQFFPNKTPKLTAFVATRGVQNVEIVLAIFSALKFEVNSIGERLEALGTPKQILKLIAINPILKMYWPEKSIFKFSENCIFKLPKKL